MNKRLYSLDIIRGIAAVSVFLTHLGNGIQENSIAHSCVEIFLGFHRYFLWCNGGLHWAVIVFIVLSGFCIHMPIAKRSVRAIIIPYYARRRFFRIYPVLFVAIVIGYLTHYIINGKTGFFYAQNLVENLSLLSGITNYFDAPLGNQILLTVVVECILYVIYPICLPIRKRGWLYILSIALLVHFANFSLLIFGEIDSTWIQRNIFSFLIYWWIGAFSSELSFNGEQWGLSIKKISKKFKAVIIIAYILYVTLSNSINLAGSHIFKSLYLSGMTGVILFAIVSFETNKKPKEPNYIVSLMKKIGEYSYSLYVIHIPIVALLNYFAMDSELGAEPIFYLINILSVIIGTALFYNIIEKPSHAYAKASSNKALQRTLLSSRH